MSFLKFRLLRLIGILTLLLNLSLPPSAAPAIDWEVVGDEGVSLLSQYLRIDTTVPPGNEMQAASFLKKWFDKEGIANQIFDLGSNRANFYALLPGKGKGKAIIFSNHMDVVYAEPADWQVPPFSGAIKDGFIWGRGAVDMKNLAVAEMMAMAVLKRNKFIPERDIIFLALADEENVSMGARRFIAEHKELLKNAAFLINEGSYIYSQGAKAKYCGVAVAEKARFG
jgi:acetylornithine deacetylase/succinyl-diaminopimelate desuccinylase-like protein